MQGDPKPHEQPAAQGAEEEHSNGWNLKTCAGPLRQRVEAGCSRGRRCLVGWDSAGVPRFGNGLFDGGPLLDDTCSFDAGSSGLPTSDPPSNGLTSLPPPRKPPTTPLKSPHPTPPTRKQRSPFLVGTKSLNLSSSASTQRATHSRPHHLPPTAAASRRRPAPPPTSTRSIRHGHLTCSVMKHCGPENLASRRARQMALDGARPPDCKSRLAPGPVDGPGVGAAPEGAPVADGLGRGCGTAHQAGVRPECSFPSLVNATHPSCSPV